MNQETPEPLQVVELYWTQLDGVRALAFGLVFFSHLEPIPIGKHFHPIIKFVLALFNQAKDWSWLGVEIFFVLSAFLITTLLLRERDACGQISFKAFFMRRTLRIWPLFFLILMISFLILPVFNYHHVPLGSPLWQAMIQSYLLPFLTFTGNFCFLPSFWNWLPLPLIATWSIAMEEQFYIVWGAILSKVRQTSQLFLILLTMLPTTILLRANFHAVSEKYLPYYFNTFSHLDPFIIGICLALLLHTGKIQLEKIKKLGPWLMFAPLLLFLSLVLFFPVRDANDVSMVYVMTLIPLGGGMLLLSLLCWDRLAGLFSGTVLVYLGRLTYGMYLYHIFAIELGEHLTITLFGSALPPLLFQAWFVYAGLSFLLTTLMAFLSWQLIEKRFLSLRKHFTRLPGNA